MKPAISLSTLRIRLLKFHPTTLILGSFILMILFGTLMLKLPISTQAGEISWIDAIFTATSAVCVTGLTVVDTGSYFSFFGQCVILFLIQIGGIGVMTISVSLFRWMGRVITFHQRMAMQDLFAHTPRGDIFKLVKSVFYVTVGAELIGTILLTIHWSHEYPFWEALFKGVFHSVSAFCNAGFALFSDSMMGYSNNLLLNLTVCGLIVIGGIGFPVLYDLQFRTLNRKERNVRLSVQTKTVLITTAVLIVSGALMFARLEHQTMKSQSIIHHVLISVFQSITTRTAGFNTVDISSLGDATLTMMIFFMFFGASPGSCGGGVKTTTLALLTAFTVSRIRRKRRVNLFKKSLPQDTVMRSISLVLISSVLIGVVLFMLLVGDSTTGHTITNAHGSFLAYLFETVSAFGTVGLSLGITPDLNLWGKAWIVGMMLIGRVGVLTFAYVLVGSGTVNGLEYSEENLMIG
ncbi:TrkH family potassium uptake protein [bacterium]|nr:TrkH family potassium uptake protein [bacterium]